MGLPLANHQHLTPDDNLEDTLFSIVEYQALQLLVRPPGLAHDTCRLTIHGFRIGLLLPMIPWIVAGVVFFMVGATAAAVLKGPTKQNDTVRQIERRLDREEVLSAQRRLNRQRAEKLEEQRKRVQELVMDQKRREERMVQMMEEARIQEQRNKALADREAQANERQKKDEQRVAREEHENERRELARQMDQLKAMEKKLKDEVENANRMAEQERAARLEAEKGFTSPLANT